MNVGFAPGIDFIGQELTKDPELHVTKCEQCNKLKSRPQRARMREHPGQLPFTVGASRLPDH